MPSTPPCRAVQRFPSASAWTSRRASGPTRRDASTSRHPAARSTASIRPEPTGGCGRARDRSSQRLPCIVPPALARSPRHAYDRARGGAPARLVPRKQAGPAVASNHGSVRDPRQRGDAAADPGRTRRPAIPRLARAVAERGCTRRCRAGRGDPRLAGPRVQPARSRAPPRGPGDRARRLAGRPDASCPGSGRTPRRRSATSPSARTCSPRRQRRSGRAAHGPLVHRRGGAMR